MKGLVLGTDGLKFGEESSGLIGKVAKQQQMTNKSTLIRLLFS